MLIGHLQSSLEKALHLDPDREQFFPVLSIKAVCPKISAISQNCFSLD